MSIREVIEDARRETGQPLKDFTVLAPQRDPYRLDTPANHDLGQWLADAYDQVNPDRRRLHLRGLHYALIGRVELPNGTPYTNTNDTWVFIERAAKAARWLGYLPWEALRDARNAPPQVFTPETQYPHWQLRAGEVEVYLPESLTPSVRLVGDLIRQPWRQIVIAEKQGVEDVLLPECTQYQATLAMPAGEISDTMVFELMRDADADGRPLVVHQVADFDPAGWQMAISTARTIQALRDSRFPDLEVRLHAVALTREQCIAWDLPSTPLKETEKRADRWADAMGWEQTELDAAVALSPSKFAEVVRDSLRDYYDADLAGREKQIRKELEREANVRLAEQLTDDDLAAIRDDAEDRLGELENLVAQINAALFIDEHRIATELPSAPEVELGTAEELATPLYDSEDHWAIATQQLIRRKRYDRGE